jgi:CHAT domain-containing protein/tetratricopeptide (TPR) repeat protein
MDARGQRSTESVPRDAFVKRTALCVALLPLAASLCAPVIAQQAGTSTSAPAAQASSPPAQAPSLTLAQAQAALQKAQTSYAENSPQVAAALTDVISLQRDAGTGDAATLALAVRLAKIEEETAGPHSAGYMSALDDQADVLEGLDREPEARVLAEQALAIGQEYLPSSTETATAAGSLGRICAALGDYPCAVRAEQLAINLARKLGGENNAELMATINNLGALKSRMGDVNGAIEAEEEALAIAYRLYPNDNHMGVIENNLGSNYLKAQNFAKATEHLNKAISMLGQLYGAQSPRLMQVHRNLANLYTRTGQFPLAWKSFEFSLKNTYAQIDGQAVNYAMFAQSLAQGGDAARAVNEGLTSARMSRELFVLQARVLPERQALAYDAVRPHGLDTAISVALRHPELPVGDIYQEVVRSRALVADEMARRQKNLNADNDPETAKLLDELNQARTKLLAAERLPSTSAKNADVVVAATGAMEGVERKLAERSAALRADERIYQVTNDDLRQNLPPHSVLVSYVAYQRVAVDRLDPSDANTLSYAAFVLHPENGRLRLFDLGAAAPLDLLVRQARAAADDEAHSGGMGSARNERKYREAALAIRRRVWDPLRAEMGAAHLVLIVADGNLNLIPFAGLPEGNGYLVEHGPAIHTLSSERDLVPTEAKPARLGLLAMGSPSFAAPAKKATVVRGATPTCEALNEIEFPPLPGAAKEVTDVGTTWRRWNKAEPVQLITGDDATLTRFLADAGHSRVLHVATHAFLLEKGCGSGNPLLHSGLVFARGGRGEPQAVLTAQQIASLDLAGVDWAVLSACNTGNGELRDGEGVLGLQRAFRVAGARSVIMTLWPVDDQATRRFMHLLYTERLEHHATTADAVWTSSRKLLLTRRAAGQSTHPWYWAGFVGSGAWE